MRKVRERRREGCTATQATCSLARTQPRSCRRAQHNTARKSGHTPASYHTTRSSTSGRLRVKISFNSCTCFPSTGRTCPLLWLSSQASSSAVGERSTASGGCGPLPPGVTPSCFAQNEKNTHVHPVQLDQPRLRLQLLRHLRHRRQLAQLCSLGSHRTSRDTPSPAKRVRKGVLPFKAWQIQGKRERFEQSKPPIWISELC